MWTPLIMLSLGGQATVIPPEQEAAYTAYVECQMRNAALFDDGISDALTVGRAIAPACRSEMEQIATVSFPERKHARRRAMFVEVLDGRAADEAAATVLMMRRKPQR